jgi:hypothetical protein
MSMMRAELQSRTRGIGYQANDWLAWVAGHRHLAVDYENDGFVFGVDQSESLIGAVCRF